MFNFFIGIKQKKLAFLLDKNNQSELLKSCYYDHSYREEVLNMLQVLIVQLEMELSDKANEQSLRVFKTYNDRNLHDIFLLEEQLKELTDLKEKIIKEVYLEILSGLPESEQLLDNWDSF